MRITNTYRFESSLVIFAVFALFLFQNCSQTKFDFASIQPGAGSTGHVLADGSFQEDFTQNPPQANNKVDILFVINSSDSLHSILSGVVGGVSGFISKLPMDSDFQVSVLPSHSPRSTNTSGRLFGARGPPVLSSKVLSLSNIQSNLLNTLTHLPGASVGGEGADEEGLASMFTALDPVHLAFNRGLGFFRSDASLAVVFVANEADVCGEPETDPHTDSDWAEAKQTALLDCVPLGINSDSVLAKLRDLQGSRPLLVSGILFPDIGQKAGIYEKEYGWGYVETVMAANGCVVPLNCNAIIDLNLDAAGITKGLESIGSLMNQKLSYVFDFSLSRKPASASCIHVKVDGQDSTFVFNAGSNSVHINNPGHIGSQISINYCL